MLFARLHGISEGSRGICVGYLGADGSGWHREGLCSCCSLNRAWSCSHQETASSPAIGGPNRTRTDDIFLVREAL